MNIKGFELVKISKEDVTEYREGFTDILQEISNKYEDCLIIMMEPLYDINLPDAGYVVSSGVDCSSEIGYDLIIKVFRAFGYLQHPVWDDIAIFKFRKECDFTNEKSLFVYNKEFYRKV